MRSTRYSKLKKTSTKTQVSPSPSEGAARRRVRGSRQTKQEDDCTANTVTSDKGTDCDLIDLIEKEHDADPVVGENWVRLLEGEEGEEVTELGEVSHCSLETTASGPTSPHTYPPMKRSTPLGLCSDCQKLYQKARKKRRQPLKDELLGNNPSSLTCDQWVLLKMWRPYRLHHMRRRLLTHLPLIRRRLGEKQIDQCVEEREQAACSRPHTFLQRNFRQCVKVSVKRVRKRTQRSRRGKRSRSVHAQGPRHAKQRRLHSASLHSDPRPQNDSLYSSEGFNSDPGLENGSERADLEEEHDGVILQVIPSSVTMVTPKPANATPKQEVPKKRGGFRDLLAQLPVKSMIVREECL